MVPSLYDIELHSRLEIPEKWLQLVRRAEPVP